MKNILFILFFSLSAVASGLKEVPMLEEKSTVKKTKKIDDFDFIRIKQVVKRKKGLFSDDNMM